MSTEIERKFLIKMPDPGRLARIDGCGFSLIRQSYLLYENGTERVRARLYKDKTVYTHTFKRRLTSMSSFEDEHTVDKQEYISLLSRRDPERNDIYKVRVAIPYEGHIFEIDIYPFWHRQAVMEVELSGEDEKVAFPPFADIIREVSGDKAYSNRSFSLKIPDEY